jgi:hypothetical protein
MRKTIVLTEALAGQFYVNLTIVNLRFRYEAYVADADI